MCRNGSLTTELSCFDGLSFCYLRSANLPILLMHAVSTFIVCHNRPYCLAPVTPMYWKVVIQTFVMVCGTSSSSASAKPGVRSSDITAFLCINDQTLLVESAGRGPKGQLSRTCVHHPRKLGLVTDHRILDHLTQSLEKPQSLAFNMLDLQCDRAEQSRLIELDRRRSLYLNILYC